MTVYQNTSLTAVPVQELSDLDSHEIQLIRDEDAFGAAPLSTSSLYRDLETTEKSGVSYRLGMAFAAIASEHVLDVPLIEHLNRTNSTLAPGSQRRADLYGVDRAGKTHVVEAKSRTYGFHRPRRTPRQEPIAQRERPATAAPLIESHV